MGKSSSSSKKIKRSKDSSKLRSVKKKKSKRNKIRRLKEEYSDESESNNSDSSLCSSSSDDDYRRQKRRSKSSKKKRLRKRKRYSSSSESDDDDGEKKRSKRKDKHKKKKKVASRKRRKSDSSSSSDDDGSESDGNRRNRVKAVQRRESEEDGEPDECWQVEDEAVAEKNPRRLKSIIVVSYAYDNDDRKGDMVDDHDDVYLTRGGNKEFGHNEESDERDDEFGEDDKSETNKASYQDNRMKDDDLEAILKKRALENLKRFRGEIQKSGMARKEVSSVSEGEPLQIKTEKVEESQDHGLVEQKKLCVSADTGDFENSRKILHEVDNVKESETVFPDIGSKQDQQSGDTTKVKVSSGISSCTTKRKLIRPVLGKESVKVDSGKEAAAGCQDGEAESINGSSIDNNCPESEIIESRKVSPALNEQSSSLAGTEIVDERKEGSQSETIEETKDGSQYEQKTMTVMRGGEMVQVSYKVYIPKKTSALGRRQLKR